MPIWGRAVKTTVEVSDDLYRRAESEAALRGRKLKDLVEEGLRLVLETTRDTHKRRSLAELLKGARGVVNSGIADLASNPIALASTRTVRMTCSGFGSNRRRPVILYAPHTSATATIREVSPQVAQKCLGIAQIRCIKALCELVIH
jgi:NADPH:quinone reductase-like Zn-dependent oxidoreductase